MWMDGNLVGGHDIFRPRALEKWFHKTISDPLNHTLVGCSVYDQVKRLKPLKLRVPAPFDADLGNACTKRNIPDWFELKH